MVAASGHIDAVPARIAIALLASFLVGLALIAVHGQHNLLIRLVPFNKPPAVLEERARTILAEVGHAATPKDAIADVGYNGDLLRWMRAERRGADRWAWLPTGRVPAVTFSYRSSPRELVPLAVIARPSMSDPPANVSGMAGVVLDTEGRLLQLSIVPPQRDPQAGHVDDAPDWAPLFAAAGLDRGRFSEASPEWTPPQFADTRAAWTGQLVELGNLPVRVEAAAYRGRPVYFSLVGPWSRPGRMQETPDGNTRRIAVATTAILAATLIVVVVVLARNNLKTGRGDRLGATRLAMLALAMELANWALGARHTDSAATFVDRSLDELGLALVDALLIWLAYLALEPMVRKRWPEGLVGWTRLLAGRWRDPLVGRDVLVGLTSGVVFGLLLRATGAASAWIGLPPGTPLIGNPDALVGGVPVLAGMLLGQVNSVILTALILVLLMVIIRAVVPWTPVAFALLALVFALLLSAELIAGEMLAFEIAMALAISSFVAAVAWRFGVLGVAAMLYFNQSTFRAPLVATFDTWYAPLTLTALAVLVGLALTAFVVARGGEPLLGRRVLER